METAVTELNTVMSDLEAALKLNEILTLLYITTEWSCIYTTLFHRKYGMVVEKQAIFQFDRNVKVYLESYERYLTLKFHSRLLQGPRYNYFRFYDSHVDSEQLVMCMNKDEYKVSDFQHPENSRLSVIVNFKQKCVFLAISDQNSTSGRHIGKMW